LAGAALPRISAFGRGVAGTTKVVTTAVTTGEQWWRAKASGSGWLGRITAPQAQVMSRPHSDGTRVGWVHQDDVVEVLRNVVGKGWFTHNHVWAETPDGFIYSSLVQPVRPQLNEPLRRLPPEGLWAEVSVPFTEGQSEPDPASEVAYRLYYTMILKADSVVTGADGLIWYHIYDENGVDMFARATDLRPIDEAELDPISPDTGDKQIRVDLNRQRLYAYEGRSEVFQARVSAGAEYFAEDGQGGGSLTKPGTYPIWSKRVSRHMVGGTLEDGYDLPGVGWVTYFASSGAAIHSTYWHNDFGRPKSHGCLNVSPDDAKWLFRWTLPHVSYVPGDVTVEWPGGTRIVIEAG